MAIKLLLLLLFLSALMAMAAAQDVRVTIDGHPSMVYEDVPLTVRHAGFENYTALVASAVDAQSGEMLKQYRCSGQVPFCVLDLHGLYVPKRRIAVGLNPFFEAEPHGETAHSFLILPALSQQLALRTDGTTARMPPVYKAERPKRDVNESAEASPVPTVSIVGNPSVIEHMSSITIVWSGFEEFAWVEVALISPTKGALFKTVLAHRRFNLWYVSSLTPESDDYYVGAAGVDELLDGGRKTSDVRVRSEGTFSIVASPPADGF